MHSRHFNNLSVDGAIDSKVVTKSSRNIDKLKYEIYFYKSAPSEFIKFMPSLVDYADDFSWYKMEYINAPNLGQLCVSEDLTVLEWGEVFSFLNELLTAFDVPGGIASAHTLEEIFIDKGLGRIHDISSLEVRNLYLSKFTINGKTLPPIAESIESAREMVRSLLSRITTLHGDLCFSNILYEKDKNKLTIVDPRGGFSEPSIYGPVIYDVSKLAQSVYGRYEQIVEKQYVLSKDGSSYGLHISKPDTYDYLENFYEELLKTFNIDKFTVKVLAGLLLVATPSLHLDDETRALALALRGAELLSGE